jgi:hypothetical protein
LSFVFTFNLKLIFVDLAQEFDVKWDAHHNRIRCQGHMLNLSAHSFLFATKDDELEGDEDNVRVKSTIQEMKAWRKKGPLGRLHNISKWIFGSDLRLQQFFIFASKRIPRDNATRWNSWQTEISTALEPEMREAISSFLDNYGDSDILEDKLSDDDWDMLDKINHMLSVLQQSSKALEGSFVSLYQALPAMDLILKHFEEGRKQYQNNFIMAPLYQSGWEKMKMYYKLSDSTPAYIAAIVLHPGYKWDYIKDEWEADWFRKAEV